MSRRSRKLQTSFDFSDFVKQMRLIKRMGSLSLMKMIRMNKIDDELLKQGEAQLKRIEAMIGSMTFKSGKTPTCSPASPHAAAASPKAAATNRRRWTRCWPTFRKCAASCSR